MSETVPIVMGPSGLLPANPADILAQLIASVTATNPGYTANLPGSLIEDISSTDVFAILACDSALVELVNSITPYGANQFLLNQLGQIYGVQQGQGSNTSVFIVFTGTPGYPIAQGFLVSDGSHQYALSQGAIVPSSGVTDALYAVATLPGAWAVPAGSVTQIDTSVPSPITLSVTNPAEGTPATGAQSIADYRAQVLQAGLAASMGMPRYLKTLLQNVPGVQQRLVSVVQTGANYKIIVGGGDPYQVAYAIYEALFDLLDLTGSELAITGISHASAAVVTTNLNHNYVTGQSVAISGVTGMTGANGTWVVTVLSETTFSIPYDSTSAPSYVSGGSLSPNRNQIVNINDYPDTYTVIYVVPPIQTVSVSLTWNTTSTFSVAADSIAALGAQAITNYINSIPVGSPINLFELQNAFQIATASILPTALLTRMVFDVYINSVLTPPTSGTGIIAGDPESYFSTTTNLITITQG